MYFKSELFNIKNREQFDLFLSVKYPIMTDSIALLIVKINGLLIQFIHPDFWTKIVIDTAILQNKDAKQFIPVVAKALLRTKFKKLDNKPLTSLFDMAVLNPKTLKKWTNTVGALSAEFKALPIGAQLAVFRLMREKRTIKQIDIDRLMTTWLKSL